ncbi:hypothetical protein D7Y21_00625 [Corallococcus sp. AB045]|uniref:hypothetical protein n=1 Tax=Corallococcus sp. AB045 TaxID=2316719 RepID=UPI000EC93431|nr:hypothetical protein [Corallococcus sp. AB045]RKH91923.1 hypothetical protein D7Y21_00625 [Corallococcus sp. AB045]
MQTHIIAVAVLTGWLMGCAPDAMPDEVTPDPAASSDEALEARSWGAVVLPPSARVYGRPITAWAKEWYRWHFRVPADRSPMLRLEQDCDEDQDGPVYFVPTYDLDTTYQRTCRVPRNRPVLVPLWVIINDYPCPDPSFEPAPGQSLEAFLRQGAIDFNNGTQDLVVTVDGRRVDTRRHRHTSGLFTFDADPSLVGKIPDPCLVGGEQRGVTDGWWLMLQLAPGAHVVRVQALAPFGAPIDYTYTLRVGR